MCHARRHAISLQRRMSQRQKVGVSQRADWVTVYQTVVVGHWDRNWHLKVWWWNSLYKQKRETKTRIVQKHNSLQVQLLYI